MKYRNISISKHSLWSKTKPGLKKKKTNEIHPERRQNPAESGSINPWRAKQIVPHLYMCQELVGKNNGREESRWTQCYGGATSRNKPESFFIIGFWDLMSVMSASLTPHCSTCSLVYFYFGQACCFPFVLPIVYHGYVWAWKVTATLSLANKAQVFILWTLGVLLFHWLAAFKVDTFLCEGVMCINL